MADWSIQVRDRLLSPLGPLSTYTRAEIHLRFNDVSTWAIEGMRADDPLAEALAWEDTSQGTQGILLIRDGVTEMSGPVRQLLPTESAESYADDETGEPIAVVDAAGIDDTGTLAWRVIQPNYDGPPYVDGYDTLTGPAQTILHEYVAHNAGTPYTDLNGRRIYGLEIGFNSGLGPNLTTTYRFTNLLVACQEIARSGTGLRFDVRQDYNVPRQRVFEVSERQDLRGRVRLAVGSGTIESVQSAITAAEATYVYGMAKGEGADRLVVERGDTAAINRYGRIEKVVDIRETDDADTIDGVLTKALTESSGYEAFEVSPLPDDLWEYGRDYRLGDQVSVMLTDGRTVEGYVVEVVIVLDSDGATVTPIIASTLVGPSSRDVARALGQRVAHLEHTAEISDTLPGDVADLQAEVDGLEAGGITSSMLAVGAAAANVGAGGVSATMLAAGSAATNLGYTPARIASGTYTGNGATPRTISVGFTPVWAQVAIVSGAGVGIQVYTGDGNRTIIEDTANNVAILTGGFVAGGFQVRDDAKSNNAVSTTYHYVAMG